MNEYDLYQRAWQRREERGLEQVAVKRGFSWPACVFGVLWAFSKRMWGLVAILAVIVIPINVLGLFALTAARDLPQWATDLLGGSVGVMVFGVVAHLTSLGIAIYVGFMSICTLV